MLDTLLNGGTLSMEQKIVIDDATYIKVFATVALCIALYFLASKYLK